jgi:GDP-mannose 6-dehydrogenase
MKVAVFGAGYVGTVTAVGLASLGHEVALVEVSDLKLDLLRRGATPVSEPGLGDVVAREVAAGRLTATRDVHAAMASAAVAMICVGTPGAVDGLADPGPVRRVVSQIAGAVPPAPHSLVVALRSTLPTPQVAGDILPQLAQTLGPRLGADVQFVVNPEFLREGCGLADFMAPPMIVVGTEHATAVPVMRELYGGIAAPFHVVAPGTASLLKYASNAFHALKVAFANEIGGLGPAFDADADRVMELFCEDHALNISPAYLRPGYAFGGSCLPKDLRALRRVGMVAGAPIALLSATLESNAALIRQSIDWIVRSGAREIALLGLSFKPGTDDLRESPLVELAEQLMGKGLTVRVHDPDIDPAVLHGSNLQYALGHLHHLAALLRDTPAEAIRPGALVIFGKPVLGAEALRAVCPPDTVVLDLPHALPRTLAPLRVRRLTDPPPSA